MCYIAELKRALMIEESQRTYLKSEQIKILNFGVLAETGKLEP